MDFFNDELIIKESGPHQQKNSKRKRDSILYIIILLKTYESGRIRRGRDSRTVKTYFSKDLSDRNYNNI